MERFGTVVPVFGWLEWAAQKCSSPLLGLKWWGIEHLLAPNHSFPGCSVSGCHWEHQAGPSWLQPRCTFWIPVMSKLSITYQLTDLIAYVPHCAMRPCRRKEQVPALSILQYKIWDSVQETRIEANISFFGPAVWKDNGISIKQIY